ncbi:hypothetical protein BpHYR1_051083 [Brachionus plicatilis]|uniref:Uncharacterized protein n=1 Tax=Brachionus plicatilis TaxID=10195 RepID=A0A3M7QYS9_BRAPC|nr:hypothetical protein BpHYR1_051083 [Brachionus plicatilis]
MISSDEIEYVYSNEFSFEYSLLCASQSSIASFQETPTSIHKGTKRKDFNFLTKKKFDFITND